MKIIGWTSFNSECHGISVNEKELMLEALQVTVSDIYENGYIFSGETHQNGHCVVPVFDNGRCLKCSMRAWAMLMSIANTGDDKKYMQFYMSQFIEEEILPKKEASYEDFIIEPDEEGFFYYYSNADLELVSESLSAGMDLMTYDYVVRALYDLLKEHLNKEE